MTDYVRNCWYVSGWSPDLKPDEPFAIDILGDPIVLWRNDEGAVTALEDRCVHRLAPLSLGRCEGANLRCMYHGFLFNNEGAVVEIPGQDIIPPNASVRRYPVIEKHSWIWVWMGDPAQADEALIPPAVGLDEPDWLLDYGYLDYDAEACLINDNLLDFSHLSYVHAKSFKAGPEFVMDTPDIRKIDRGVRISRWICGTPGPQRVGHESVEPVDWWSSYEYLLPGVLIMWSGSFKAGTAEACNDGPPPDLSKAIRAVSITSQAVTPLSDGKARYFFSTGPLREHGDQATLDGQMKMTAAAFAEDKIMIEAQHKRISSTANPVNMPSTHDRAVTIFNGLVQKLSRAEKSSV